MSASEKFGLVLMLIYFGNNFPPSWKGAEVVFFLLGCTMFMQGKYIDEWIDAFREVK